jgi:hypothetical protein
MTSAGQRRPPLPEAPPLTPEEHTLLRRRMAALSDPEMRLRDWDGWFVGDVCWRKRETLTPRQREMVAVLCWRYREQIAALPDHPWPEIIPAKEPKLKAREDAPTRHRAAARARA